jgi:hypothetical protein
MELKALGESWLKRRPVAVPKKAQTKEKEVSGSWVVMICIG